MGGRDLVAHARELRATIRQWTGIPTCVGLGPSKTLAKLANWVAKHDPDRDGVCDEAMQLPVMARILVGEVWGVGLASAAKLDGLGCRTTADLAALDRNLARKVLTVVGERIVLKLQGRSCSALEQVAPQRKGCAVTRMFSRRVGASLSTCQRDRRDSWK